MTVLRSQFEVQQEKTQQQSKKQQSKACTSKFSIINEPMVIEEFNAFKAIATFKVQSKDDSKHQQSKSLHQIENDSLEPFILEEFSVEKLYRLSITKVIFQASNRYQIISRSFIF